MSSFPSWASSPTSATTNNPLLRATPLTNQAICEQRRGMTPASGTYTSSLRNSSLPQTPPLNFDRSTVAFGSAGNNRVSSSTTSPASSRRPSVSQNDDDGRNNFVPREESRQSYYYQHSSPQQQQFRDPYLQTNNVSPNNNICSSPNSPNATNASNNQERMRNYMQRPGIESGIVTSPSPASSPTTTRHQNTNSNNDRPNSFTNTQRVLTAHDNQPQFSSSSSTSNYSSSSLSRMNQHLHQQQQNNANEYQNFNSSPSDRIYHLAQSRSHMFSTEASSRNRQREEQFSERSNAANERLNSAERLIAEVMMRHGHLLSDDERRSSEFSGMMATTTTNNNNMKSSSSPTSSASLHNITSPQQLQRSGFALSTIQKIVHLSHTLEQGKETVKESDEKANRIRSDFINQVSQVQDQIEKMNQQMENWKRQIQDLSPLRVRGSQFSFEPTNQRNIQQDEDEIHDDDDTGGNENYYCHVNNSRSGSVLGHQNQPKFGSYHHVGNGDRSGSVHDLPMTVNFDEI